MISIIEKNIEDFFQVYDIEPKLILLIDLMIVFDIIYMIYIF